ncbi:hypothetical protein [Candidatus Methylomirabilis sp.]|uniref:hypothetical protein n=1 Tax=Candidatus Methylomirabilis sp. TaxID=2032687 RepID=UPI0030766689
MSAPTGVLDRVLLDELTRPGSRLPGIAEWLMNEVWTMDRYRAVGQKPVEYLRQGEALVHQRETLLTLAGESLYDELAAGPPANRSLRAYWDQFPGASVVILDGCSLRELPRLVELADASGRAVLDKGYGMAAIPSETEPFIEQRMGLGLPAIAPSALPGRRELHNQGIRAYWMRQPTERIAIEDTCDAVLLWARFPDMRFLDSHAASPELFDAIWDMMQSVWMKTVQVVPSSKPVLVTSDHGYIFLGQGLSEPTLNNVDKPLEGKRFRECAAHESLPERRAGLWVDPARRLAVLAGRVHNRPQAPSPSNSLYRHGGLSLMEMLTPWLVLGPKDEHA